MTVEIKLSKGYVAIVDDDDADLGKYRCCTLLARKNPPTPYGAVTIDGVRVQLHRIILGRILGRTLSKSEFVDHRDGNSLNNTRGNLRLTTPSQNNANRPLQSNNRSGYKGVCWSIAAQQWVANITVNHRRIYLGTFDSPEAAHDAYIKAASEHFGEFAAPVEITTRLTTARP